MSGEHIQRPGRAATRNKPWAVLLLALLLAPSAYLAWQVQDMPHFGLRHDDSLYWVCAKSLAQGRGYRILSLPGEPYQTKYPPLYSWLLSGVWRVHPGFPDHLRLATWLCWLTLAALLLLSRRLFADFQFGAIGRFALTMALAVNPLLVLYGLSLYSEIPFTCLLLGCCVVAHRAQARPWGWGLAALAGALAGAGYLTRAAGIALVVAGPLYFVLRRRYRHAAAFLGASLPAVLGWEVWVRAHRSASTDMVTLFYTDYLSFHLANFGWRDEILVAWKNLPGMLSGMGHLLLYLPFTPASAALGAVAAFGLVRLKERAGFSLYHLFAVAQVLLLLFWPLLEGEDFERLLLPLLPLLVAGLWTLLAELLSWVRRLWRCPELGRTLLACAVSVPVGVVLFVGGLGWFATAWRLPGFFADQRAKLSTEREAYRWIEEHLPADATFLTGSDPKLYLYSGRQGCVFVVPQKPFYLGDQRAIAMFYDTVAEYVRSHRLTHMLLGTVGRPGSETPQIGGRTVRVPPSAFRLLYRSRGILIYEAIDRAEDGSEAPRVRRVQAGLGSGVNPGPRPAVRDGERLPSAIRQAERSRAM